ncbi:MAG: hypothetical protein ACRDV3_00115, partial [Acidothermaceae bacterium]
MPAPDGRCARLGDGGDRVLRPPLDHRIDALDHRIDALDNRGVDNRGLRTDIGPSDGIARCASEFRSSTFTCAAGCFVFTSRADGEIGCGRTHGDDTTRTTHRQANPST